MNILDVIEEIKSYMSNCEVIPPTGTPLLVERKRPNYSRLDRWLVALKNSETYKEMVRMQYQIDNLMLEYCPEEMSDEQFANWEECQIVSDNQLPLPTREGVDGG